MFPSKCERPSQFNTMNPRRHWNIGHILVNACSFCANQMIRVPVVIDTLQYGRLMCALQKTSHIWYKTNTHPDSPDWLHRSHVKQYHCGYCKVEYLCGYSEVFCSYSNKSYHTAQHPSPYLCYQFQLEVGTLALLNETILTGLKNLDVYTQP